MPGGRAPHYWLAPGRSLYDTFGFEWTLLQLGSEAPRAESFEVTAYAQAIDLQVVEIPSDDVRSLYEAPLAFIRPDQVVAWRGAEGRDADAVFCKVLGKTDASAVAYPRAIDRLC